MGPACSVVDARDDSATLWTGSQKPHFARDGIARVLGLPPEKVHRIWVPGSGSYGCNDAGDALRFEANGSFDLAQYDFYVTNYELIADMLANDLILGWVSGKYEIGPRALGNRSILAAPFQESTRVRLNEIKQREQFRPIAPVCLEEEAARWFGCDHESPFMLYTHHVRTDALAAITHVNGTARIQTVSSVSNRNLYDLLIAFKARTGYGVLCNTSLNFNGRGFINKIGDLSEYVSKHNLDGFVVEGRTYLLKTSKSYQAYLRMPNGFR
jgi:predicted NodU family carbamoyl transferase